MTSGSLGDMQSADEALFDSDGSAGGSAGAESGVGATDNGGAGDGAGGAGGAGASDWRRISLGDGFNVRYKGDAALTGETYEGTNGESGDAGDLTITLRSAETGEISNLSAEIFYDNTAFTPVEAEFRGILAEAEIKLILLNLPDRVAAGAAFVWLARHPVTAGDELLTVRFTRGAARSIAQSFNRVPVGAENKPLNLSATYDDINQALTINWRGRAIGDYDQSGEVGIPDITPVALYYGYAVGSILAVVDGDFSGEIGIPDITPIANNYLTLLTGWNVYLGTDDGGGNYTYERLGASVPTVPRRDADNLERLNVYTYGTALASYGNYRVRVVPIGPDGVESGGETYAEFDYEHTPPVPPAPENQRLTGLDLDYATISWDEITSPLVAQVHCWKSTVGGTDLANYTLDATYDTTPFPTSHTFLDLSPLTDYWFIITTTSTEDVDSIVPDPVQAFTDTPPNPPAPANQTITAVTPDSATAGWDAVTDPLIAEIYCWKSTTGGTDLADYTLDATYSMLPLPTEHTFAGLDVSTQYYFAITSKSPLGKESGVETVLEAFTSQSPTAVIAGPSTMLLDYSRPGYGMFSGAGSTDPDVGDTIVEYRWNWGDGGPDEIVATPDVTHTAWPAADTYTVSLVVVDSHGVSSAPATQDVEVVQGRTDILLVYNTNAAVTADSFAVADYYTDPETGRGIAPANVVGFDWDDPAEGDLERVTRDYYTNTIRANLETFLNDSGLKDVIKYIVLCKGVPLKVNNVSGSNYEDLDYASVDAELCLLFEDYDVAGRTVNPFRAEVTPVTEPFEPFIYRYQGTYLGEYQDVTLSYLVSRLDAYTLDEVKLIIDRAKAAPGNTDGYIILDDHPSRNYDMMHSPTADGRPSAFTVLTNYGANLKADNTNERLTRTYIADDEISQNVVGFCGHGVHHGGWPSGAEYILNDLDFAYRPGALFISYESFNGYSFEDPSKRAGQGLVADFLRMGGTCGIGNVWEPWSDAVGDESVAFVQYLDGDNAIEAMYRSLRYISWCEVVVGDPLCTIAG